MNIIPMKASCGYVLDTVDSTTPNNPSSLQYILELARDSRRLEADVRYVPYFARAGL